MKALLFIFIFFICFNIIAAQSIFIPWKGQREIFKLRDIKNEIDAVAGNGEQCGEYFIYRKNGDQKILTFKMHTTEHDDKMAVMAFQNIGQKVAKILIDNKAKIPTAEYSLESEVNSYRKPSFIIRISKDDYKTSKCLSNFDKYKK